jgi:hypothetical protein
VSLETFPHRIVFLSAALSAMSAFAGCASHDLKEPNRLHAVDPAPKHWYDSDMDSQDRSFFLGSFFNQDR